MRAPLRWRTVASRLATIAILACLAACGEDASTGIGGAPALLTHISAQLDTVVTGESSDLPLSVRVENTLSEPVEGIPVRFLVVSGEGSAFPNLAVSSVDGIAEATFRAADTPGDSRIRVDIPSATDVASIDFTFVTEPADSVVLTVVAGSDQSAEPSSQLSLPFVVAAKTPSGSSAGGTTIAWRVESPVSGAVFTADTTLTGSDGRSQTVLTLGAREGTYAVVASTIDGVASEAVRFSVEADANLVGSVRIDSVSPPDLVAGQAATLFGSGFSSLAGNNEVRIEGVAATVLDASSEHVGFLVPAFGGECLPARDVGLRVLTGGEASNGELVRLLPAQTPIDLEVGEVAIARGSQAVSCLQFLASAESRAYRIGVQSVRAAAEDATTIRLITRTGEEAPRTSSTAASVRASDLAPAVQQRLDEVGTVEMTLRENAHRELERRRAVPLTPAPTRDTTAADAPVAASFTGAVPSPGDTLSHFFAVKTDFTASCADTTNVIRSRVRAAGENVVLLEDLQANRTAYSEAQWSALAAELDQVTFPTDTSYFGSPADIDGNERVLILFTPEVNRLNSAGAGIGGFFLPLDLAASGRGGGGLPGPGGEACPASNEAEILYVITPDPDGTFGEAIQVPQFERNARSIPAHELEHLINAQARVLDGQGGFGAAEEVWLDEGLAHFAEEVVGLALGDFSTGQNLGFDAVASTREELDVFNAFHINNFFQLSLYMFAPQAAPVLSAADPGGLSGVQMRGFSWFFARWTADRFGGGDERSFIRSLVAGGQNRARGTANYEQATGIRWEDLIADFAVALSSDDSGLGGLGERYKVTTWDFRDVFVGLSQNPTAGGNFPLPFPLGEKRLGYETSATDFDVEASAVGYFTMNALAPPALAVSAVSPSGEMLDEASVPQVVIVRTR